MGHKLATDGIYSKIISMPCHELFDQQSEDYKSQILGETSLIVSIEASETNFWKKIRNNGLNFGINNFGKAPHIKKYMITLRNSENIIKELKRNYENKIGINGMGRIGRMIIRSIIENNYNNIEIKHINNRTNSDVCSALLNMILFMEN